MLASSLSGADAGGVANSGGGVPEAIDVSAALVVSGIAVGALSLANLVGVVPFAGSGEGAFGLCAEDVALGGALVAEGIPEAVAVGVTA